MGNETAGGEKCAHLECQNPREQLNSLCHNARPQKSISQNPTFIHDKSHYKTRNILRMDSLNLINGISYTANIIFKGRNLEAFCV